jgi:putative membrane protein
MWAVLLSGIATALSLLVVDLTVPGVTIDTVTAAAIAAVAVGVVNAFVKPVVEILALPLTFLTFGLFSLVVNGFCLWLASVFVPGFYVQGILGFLLGPVVLSLVNAFLNDYLAKHAPPALQESSDLSTGNTPQKSE